MAPMGRKFTNVVDLIQFSSTFARQKNVSELIKNAMPQFYIIYKCITLETMMNKVKKEVFSCYKCVKHKRLMFCFGTLQEETFTIFESLLYL